MLTSFDKEDLYKLVKAKYGSTRPVEDLDLLLWGDSKTMFEPLVEDAVWRKQQGYKVLEWKLYDSCGAQMDDPNITMEEYIRLEEEKARRRGKVYNWETATYALSCDPMISSLNDEDDFRISFDEFDDEEYSIRTMMMIKLIFNILRENYMSYHYLMIESLLDVVGITAAQVYVNTALMKYQYNVSYGMDIAYRLPV
nr:hypothetical protein [Tanacetum cinerariifolium]GEY85968.1 hypothetical protein [Tanacetum cinerariifolium]